MSAGNINELRPPMTRAKRRIHPFHQKTVWSMRNAIRSAPHGFDTLRKRCYDVTRALRYTTRFRHPSNIIEYIRETRWLEVHYRWRAWQSLSQPRNRAITDGANIAQFLGKNYVRAQLMQERFVDCINCPFVT